MKKFTNLKILQSQSKAINDAFESIELLRNNSNCDKLGVTSSAVGRILAADNCGLREFIRILDAVDLYKRSYIHTMRHFTLHCCYDYISSKLETTPAKVKLMLASENMKLSTFLKLTEATGVSNDYFKFD